MGILSFFRSSKTEKPKEQCKETLTFRTPDGEIPKITETVFDSYSNIIMESSTFNSVFSKISDYLKEKYNYTDQEIGLMIKTKSQILHLSGKMYTDKIISEREYLAILKDLGLKKAP